MITEIYNCNQAEKYKNISQYSTHRQGHTNSWYVYFS